MYKCKTIKYFNSHAHVERDSKAQSHLDDCQNFNSHAHVERDETAIIKGDGSGISTHTLTWSVTTS